MPLMDPFKKIQCPFCNKELYPAEYLVVSRVNPGKQPLYTPPAHVSLRERFWFKDLSTYKGELAALKCPYCDNILPPNIPAVDDNITIAIIGDSFSGKSHYIASLIYELKRLHIPGRFFEIIGASNEVDDFYLRNYYRPLFENQEEIAQTQLASSSVNTPLVYQVTYGDAGGSLKKFNLLFYDASGEDLARDTALVRHKAPILNARGIIFMVDPWSIPKFVDNLAHRLRPAVRPPRTPSEVLGRVIETFQQVKPELAAETIFPLPTAIVLPKADLIEYHFLLGQDHEFDYLWRTDFTQPYNIDHATIDQLMRKMLFNLNEGVLLNAAGRFASASFFAISATGSASDDQRRYQQIRPHRCLDPLLWILRELERID